MYKGIISAFSPLNKVYDLDPIPCLPNPYLPNIQRYAELGKIVFKFRVLLDFANFELLNFFCGISISFGFMLDINDI